MSDEQLSAYLDGELPGERIAEIEAALAAEPSLAARLAAMRSVDAQLQQAFAGVVEEPATPRLEALLQGKAPAAPVRAGRPGIFARPAQLAALAASFVLGLAAPGLLLASPSTAFVVDPAGVVMASAETGRALDQLRSGETARLGAATLAVRLSFRDGAGRYCREFELASATSLSCKGKDGWMIEALAKAPPGRVQEGYAMAGGPAGAEMEAARARLGVHEVLDASAEVTAIASGWGLTRR